MHRSTLLKLLLAHRSQFMEELAYTRRAIDFIRQHAQVFERELSMHVTGSAWVVNPECDKVLLLHHRKLGHWLQPGGHADGDADVVRVALRECAEETGIDPGRIHLLEPEIFDVDIHSVPVMANAPLHAHIDIRFLVEIDDRLPIPGNHESHEIAWLPLYQVLQFNHFRSTYRMLQKTRVLRRLHGRPCLRFA
jgi:8-oxo-dGTP pyrophosphatase MutT (NUDIX family)